MVKKVEIHHDGAGLRGNDYLENSINESLNKIRERENTEIIDVKPLDYNGNNITVLVVYDE
jgi:hypothetical protein